MNETDCLIHWPPQEWTIVGQERPIRLSKDAALGLVSRDLQRINEGQLKWMVYDPVTQLELYTYIGGYSNG